MRRRARRGRDRPGRLAAPAAVVTSALVLAGCSGYTGNHAHRVGEWASAASLSANDALIRADIAGIASGIARRELRATRTECDGLATDAGTAYGELPTPDRALTGDLNTAYLDDVAAAESCTAARSFASPRFARYRREIAAGVAALRAATRRLAAIGPG